jgi:hypothetical protein
MASGGHDALENNMLSLSVCAAVIRAGMMLTSVCLCCSTQSRDEVNVGLSVLQYSEQG